MGTHHSLGKEVENQKSPRERSGASPVGEGAATSSPPRGPSASPRRALRPAVEPQWSQGRRLGSRRGRMLPFLDLAPWRRGESQLLCTLHLAFCLLATSGAAATGYASNGGGEGGRHQGEAGMERHNSEQFAFMGIWESALLPQHHIMLQALQGDAGLSPTPQCLEV